MVNIGGAFDVEKEAEAIVQTTIALEPELDKELYFAAKAALTRAHRAGREEAEVECIKLVCGDCEIGNTAERTGEEEESWWVHHYRGPDGLERLDCLASNIHESRRAEETEG